MKGQNILNNLAQKLMGANAYVGFSTDNKKINLSAVSLGKTSVLFLAARLSETERELVRQKHNLEFHVVGELSDQNLLSTALSGGGEKLYSLTVRETEVLELSSEGKTYIEIAAHLNISSRTVRFFLENARQKLGCANTTHAVAFALQHGLI